MKISITIIGHNEEYHLKELLPQLNWADEVIYVDCESSDKSYALAKKLGARVFKRPNNQNLNINKSYAMQKARGEWIFYLDPDERIPEDLSMEILSKIDSSPSETAFQLSRRNYYFGKWLRHGSRYPDTQLRLFKKGCARFPNEHVHEKLIVRGKTGSLAGDMNHLPFISMSQFFKKFDFYTSFEAAYLKNRGQELMGFNRFKYVIYQPLTRFIRRYFFKLGFLDGLPGFFACLFDALKYIVTYFKFQELKSKE